MKQKHHNSSLAEVNQSVHVPPQKGWFKTLLAFVGPAYLVSVGYMDPGNWATDIAGGSRFGYSLIWVLLMSNIMALLLQTLSARLGIVKVWDLAQASRQQYPNWVNLSLYVFAEVAIAATDLAEIIGMAIGLSLLFKLPLLYGVLITAFDTFLLLFLINKGIRILEAFILVLVSIIGLSFIVELFIVEPNLVEVSKGFIPSNLEGEALYIAIGIIGATVMPHNLYLHSSLVQTRRFERNDQGILKAIKYNFIDSAIALNAAFVVNASILILSAAAFFKNGIYTVTEIQDAYHLLTDLFGNLAPVLFAVALILAGQSSTITGTLAGQIVMEGYLNLRISPWLRRLITRLVAIVPALFTILYLGEEKLGELLILSQVVLSIQLGFAVIPLVYFTSSKAVMGKFAINNWVKLFAWICTTIIVLLNIKLVYEEVNNFMLHENSLMLSVLLIIALAFAVFLMLYILLNPLFNKPKEKQIIPHATLNNLDLPIIKSFKNIGITVDFSVNDNKAIAQAIAIGGKSSSYKLIHIVESAGAKRYGQFVSDKESEADAENINLYVTELIEKGYDVTADLGFGNRSTEISRLVNEYKLDFLVMGAHGHGSIKDFIFGSTVDAVRHKVDIPVLVVQ